MNKMASHVLDIINTARDDWEAAERSGPPPTFSNGDTQELVTALATGRAFKIVPVPQLSRQTSTPTSTTSPGRRFHRQLLDNNETKCLFFLDLTQYDISYFAAAPKGPGPIKTNIKSAHTYSFTRT